MFWDLYILSAFGALDWKCVPFSSRGKQHSCRCSDLSAHSIQSRTYFLMTYYNKDMFFLFVRLFVLVLHHGTKN